MMMASSSRLQQSQLLRRVATRCFTSAERTGAGIGNVRDHMLPSLQEGNEVLFRHQPVPKTMSIIGAPMTYGQPFVGTDSGPTQLRDAGIRGMMTSLGWRVEDVGDIDCEGIAKNAASSQVISTARNCAIVGAVSQKVAEVIEEKIKVGRFPLLLGGDHSIGIGSLAAVMKARPNTGVLWIDAHADINTPDISESGNMHGMPVGLLMEGIDINYDELPGLGWLKGRPKVKPDSLVYIGLRDVDPAERHLIRNLGIKAFTMHDIDHYGIGHVMDMAFEHLLKNDPNRPLHMSYDIDAVDPVLAPATGTTVRGGLTFREAHFVAEFAAQSGNLASADIVELNPSLSDGEGAQETVELGLQIVTSMLGKSII